jgi:hypothetical protein
MGDGISNKICEDIHAYINDRGVVIKNNGDYDYRLFREFELTFTFGVRPYTTIFEVMTEHHKNKNSNYIHISNGCITIGINNPISKDGDTSIEYDETTFIRANTDEHQCFEPRLVSESRNKGERINSTDILQTLKTKLLFCLMPEKRSIALEDIATKGGVQISKFNILRGKPTIYEKYGYEAGTRKMDQFKVKIGNLTWGELDEGLKKYITDTIPAELRFEDITPLTEIMKNISFEYEMTNYSVGLSPSSRIFDFLLHGNTGVTWDDYVREDGLDDYTTYILRRDNELWKRWDSQLLFVNFENIGESRVLRGGSRKRKGRNTRKTRNTRNTRKVSKRVSNKRFIKKT